MRFGAWVLAGLGVYALYGVHGSEQRELEHLRERSAGGAAACRAAGPA